MESQTCWCINNNSVVPMLRGCGPSTYVLLALTNCEYIESQYKHHQCGHESNFNRLRSGALFIEKMPMKLGNTTARGVGAILSLFAASYCLVDWIEGWECRHEADHLGRGSRA